MMRAISPDWLESIANDPRVFPKISQFGQGPIRLGQAWDSCIGLEFEGGGWLLHRHAPHYYEVHTLFLPKSRNVREKAAQAQFYMFTATECEELVTKVPDDLPHALALAKAMGMKERFRRTDAWLRESGAIGITCLGMTITDWIIGNKRLMESGRFLHRQLGAYADHEDDPVHDAYTGFALECAKAQLQAKGLVIYNKWAALAGYRQLGLDEDGAIVFDGIWPRMDAERLHITEDETCQQQQS